MQVTKAITDPKDTTIRSVKEEIERSKTFLDGLKKAKDKNPDCFVKPRVTAQSKGITSYKGVFGTLVRFLRTLKVLQKQKDSSAVKRSIYDIWQEHHQKQKQLQAQADQARQPAIEVQHQLPLFQPAAAQHRDFHNIDF